MAASPTARRLIRAAFFIVPPLFLLIGLWMAVDTIRFLGASQRVEAEVVEVIVTRRGEGQRIEIEREEIGALDESIIVYDEGYTAVVRFELDGQTHTAPTHIESDTYDFDVGTKITVRADPADLSEVRVASFWSLWIFPLVFTFLGGGVTALVILGRGQIERQLEKM